MAVDEARVLHCFPRTFKEPENSGYVAEPNIIASDIRNKKRSFFGQYLLPVFLPRSECHYLIPRYTLYQDIPFPQEIKEYAGSLQAKGISNVYIVRSKDEIGFKDMLYVPQPPPSNEPPFFWSTARFLSYPTCSSRFLVLVLLESWLTSNETTSIRQNSACLLPTLCGKETD